MAPSPVEGDPDWGKLDVQVEYVLTKENAYLWGIEQEGAVSAGWVSLAFDMRAAGMNVGVLYEDLWSSVSPVPRPVGIAALSGTLTRVYDVKSEQVQYVWRST